MGAKPTLPSSFTTAGAFAGDGEELSANSSPPQASPLISAKRIARGALEYKLEHRLEPARPEAADGAAGWATRAELIARSGAEIRAAERDYFERKWKAVAAKGEKKNLKKKLGNAKKKPAAERGRRRQALTDSEVDSAAGTPRERILRHKHFFFPPKTMFSDVYSHRKEFPHLLDGRSANKRTGLAFDVNCWFHFGNPDEPENPERYEAAVESLSLNKLKNRCFPVLPELGGEGAFELIAKLHSKEYSQAVIGINNDLGPKAILISNESDSYYENRFTANAVHAAAELSARLALLVFDGKLDNGACVVRPPGHHFEHDRAFGFCHANNISIAAKAVLRRSPGAKLLIFDWDLHHGNGTEDIFYDEPRVLYISAHQEFDDGGKPMFPGTGSLSDVGGRNARGRNVNLPLPIGCGDAEYRSLLDLVVLPVLREFEPDLVLLSAGFDSCAGDPLGALELSPRMFAYLTRRFMAAQRDGRVVLFLEGGYSARNVGMCVSACVGALLGDESDYDPQPSLEEDFLFYVDHIIRAQRVYWKSLYSSNALENLQNLHPDVRRFQPQPDASVNGRAAKRKTRGKKLVALRRYREAHPEIEADSSVDADSGSSFVVDSDEAGRSALRPVREKKLQRKRAPRDRRPVRGRAKLRKERAATGLRLVAKTFNAGEVIDLTLDAGGASQEDLMIDAAIAATNFAAREAQEKPLSESDANDDSEVIEFSLDNGVIVIE